MERTGRSASYHGNSSLVSTSLRFCYFYYSADPDALLDRPCIAPTQEQKDAMANEGAYQQDEWRKGTFPHQYQSRTAYAPDPDLCPAEKDTRQKRMERSGNDERAIGRHIQTSAGHAEHDQYGTGHEQSERNKDRFTQDALPTERVDRISCQRFWKRTGSPEYQDKIPIGWKHPSGYIRRGEMYDRLIEPADECP